MNLYERGNYRMIDAGYGKMESLRNNIAEIENAMDEVEKISLEGQRQLVATEQQEKEECVTNNSIEVPFCCTTTLPKVFNVITNNVFITFNSCLHCKTIQDTVEAKCGNGISCGQIDACITKVVGCIQFVAAADIGVGGSGFQSAIGCQGCVCVDECVKCEAGCPSDDDSCPCPTSDPIVPVSVKPGSLRVCVRECAPCTSTGGTIGTNTVTFSGVFLIPKNFCNND